MQMAFFCLSEICPPQSSAELNSRYGSLLQKRPSYLEDIIQEKKQYWKLFEKSPVLFLSEPYPTD